MTAPGQDVAARLAEVAEQQQEEVAAASEAPAQDIVALGEEFATLTREVNDLEAMLKTLKGRREQIRKVELPDAMRAAGMVNGNKGSFTITAGRIQLSTKLYVSAIKEETEALYAWLKENGLAELVKETVSGSSLAAYVRERREEGEADPPHVSVYEETAASFVASKA